MRKDALLVLDSTQVKDTVSVKVKVEDVNLLPEQTQVTHVVYVLSRRKVIEINPDDQDSTMIEIPKEGDRVRVIGAWVTDGETLGWNEIHPAWQIEVL
jgi:hypothetical protein